MRVLIFDTDRCLSCHSCELACAVAHSGSSSLIEAVLTGKRSSPRLWVISLNSKIIVITCRHCLRAPCIKACPTQALQRHPQTGAVIVEESLCIGCRDCVLACPFGAIKVENGLALKCDLCGGEPSCVRHCPTEALRFIAPEEEIAKKQRRISQTFLVKGRRP